MEQSESELVVLLHGIMDGPRKMRRLEKMLQAEGYTTINIAYPSTRKDLDALTDHLHDVLALSRRFNGATKTHFIGHSMGGLLTRYYLHKYRPDNLGRVVMAGTPNQGSAFANMLSDYPVLAQAFGVVCGPAGAQLREGFEHNPAFLVDYELGIIAGAASLNPLAGFVLKGDNDGTVSVESTKLPGMKDHIVVKAKHPFMMDFRCVQEQALHFLRRGQFNHP